MQQVWYPKFHFRTKPNLQEDRNNKMSLLYYAQNAGNDQTEMIAIVWHENDVGAR